MVLGKVAEAEYSESQNIVTKYQVYFNHMEKLWILTDDCSRNMLKDSSKQEILRKARIVCHFDKPANLVVYNRYDSFTNEEKFGLSQVRDTDAEKISD